MVRSLAFSSVIIVCLAVMIRASFSASPLMAEEAAATAVSAAEKAPDHGHDGHESGPPMAFTADLALWSLIVFVSFLFVLKKFAWGPMIEGLDKREEGIRKAIADAEDGRRKSQAMLAEYEQKLKAAEKTVQEMVAEARRDAERTSQDLIASAQKEVNLIRERSRDEIRQATDTALSEVFSQINSQVLRATEHVLGRALGDQDEDRLVAEALAEVSR